MGAGDADGTRTACHLLASSDAQRKAHGGGGSIRTKPPRGPEQLVVGHTEKARFKRSAAVRTWSGRLARRLHIHRER